MRAVSEALQRGDAAAAREPLHRLKASCGFVGALALLAAVQRLAAHPERAEARSAFEACARQLLAR
jgi:hypothetical protein